MRSIGRAEDMSKNIITVTRQFGSLGRPIAKKVAEKLKFKVKSEKVCKLFSVENDIKLPSSWPSF
jgi:hypothetical protein